MTNGEKLQEIFPNAEINYGLRGVVAVTFIHKTIFDLDWWNDEYKEPTDKIDCDNTDCNNCVNHKYCDYESNKSEIPTGSTTKNDLGVDCIDRKEFIDWINVWDITPIIKRPLIRHVQGMPPVTSIRPKGHWREVDTNMYACSKCSHVLTINPLDNSILEMNTCPFCSVKMEGVEE